MKPRVFFYVQHLLGIGHVVRSTRIARALAQDGFRVDLVLGGPPIAGLDAGGARLSPLPPVRAAPGGFSELIDAEGRPLDAAGKAARRDALLAMFDAAAPDILLIEAFPFGRRQMRFELLPLLERAHERAPRPLIVSSVRDILQQERRPGRAEEYAELVERYFDLVLVHGDPKLATFGDSFSLAERIITKIRYTGIVGPGVLNSSSETNEIIVSAGGGAVGERLFRAVLAAKPFTSVKNLRWLIVTGPNINDNIWNEFNQHKTFNLDFVKFLSDFPSRLSKAKLSISQAGYNTVADILNAGCNFLLIPYNDFGETEQIQRAKLIEKFGITIYTTDLSPKKLATSIDLSSQQPNYGCIFNLQGAGNTGDILRKEFFSRTY